MALNYGYTPEKLDIVKTYLYNFSYESLHGKAGWNKPKTLNSGYPATSIYLPDINSKTKITLLNHTFDNDAVISNLSVKYATLAYMKDGSKQQQEIITVNITSKNKINFGGYQSVPLGISVYLKDQVTNVNEVVMFYVQIRKTAGGNYGNESNLNVAVGTYTEN